MTKILAPTCTVCKKRCRKNQNCIECDNCQNKFHYKCTDLNPKKNSCSMSDTMIFYCKVCYVHVFPFTSLSDCDFINMFKDIDFNLVQLIDNVKFANLEVSDNIYNHEYVQNHCNYTSLHSFSKLLKQNKSEFDLSLIHFNMRSLPKNLHKIEDFLFCCNALPKIIAISETKLKSSKVCNVNLNNYSFLHNDSITQAGGVGLYVHSNIKYLIREDLFIDLEGCENLWIVIITPPNKKNMIISVIYRHSYCNVDLFQDKLCSVLKAISSYKYTICGDINIDLLKWESNIQTSNYMNELYSAGAVLAIDKPTRLTNTSATLIDHIYTNNLLNNVPVGILIYEVSDHLPVYIVFKDIITQKQQNHVYRDIKNFNIDTYREEMFEKLNKSYIKTLHDNQNFLYQNFAEIFCNLLNSQAPLRQFYRKDLRFINKPWLTSGIIKSIKTKNKMFKKCYKSCNSLLIKKYKQYSNKLTKIKNAAKISYTEKLETTKNDIRKQWKVVNEVIGRKHLNSHTPTKIVDQKGNQITEQQEICNKFNNFFSNIGQNISKTIPLCTTSNNPSSIISQHKKSFFFTPITSNKIMIQIGKLDNKKSPGIDKIQNKFLKYVGDIISPFLAEIFNNHIRLGKFPQELKTAKIVPIHKNGSHSLTTNYRPISILSSFSKFLKNVYTKDFINTLLLKIF